MSDKRYPTRMHEVLGVEPHEPFEVKGHDGKFILDSSGAVRFGKHFEHSAYSEFVAEIINNPERITRRPRLTEEQADQLKALVTLGYRWLVEERGGTVVAVNNEVKKGEVRWVLTNPRDSDDVVCDVHQSLSVKSLVSWSDPAPLDIVQTLRDAGVEVDDA